MIIDKRTSDNTGAAWDDEPASGSTLIQELSNVTSDERQARFGQNPVTVLFTGLPGAGKTTTAYGVERALFDKGRAATVIDGQNLRMGLNRDLNFSSDGRSENVRRAAEVGKLVNKSGVICLLALVSPDDSVRKRAAEVVGKESFIVVHLNASEEVCAGRNESAKQRGDDDLKESSVTYQAPTDADLVLDTENVDSAACIAQVLELLETKGVI